jgi:hypothetical protein
LAKRKWESKRHWDSTSLQSEWLSSINITTNGGEDVGEKELFYTVWWECKLVQTIWKAIWTSFKKQKTELPHDPVIPLSGIYPMECAPGYDRATCTPIFIAALFTIAKLWKQRKYPMTDEWIKKMWCIYTQCFIQP